MKLASKASSLNGAPIRGFKVDQVSVQHTFSIPPQTGKGTEATPSSVRLGACSIADPAAELKLSLLWEGQHVISLQHCRSRAQAI